MRIDFFLAEMTYLRYFVPLALEAMRRGHDCCVLYGRTIKYSNPCSEVNFPKLTAVGDTYGIGLCPMADRASRGVPEYSVCLESYGTAAPAGRRIVLTAVADFTILHRQYRDLADYIVYPNEVFATHYGVTTGKDLYVGSPKYDIAIDPNAVRRKYSLPERVMLVLLPHGMDIACPEVLECVRQTASRGKRLGYTVVAKYRAKHRPRPGVCTRYDRYMEDVDWYPHTTMELMAAADICINFGSGAVKEALMSDTPMLNYPVKSGGREYLRFLYEPPCVRELPIACTERQFAHVVEDLTRADLTEAFRAMRARYLHEGLGTSARICEAVGL